MLAEDCLPGVFESRCRSDEHGMGAPPKGCVTAQAAFPVVFG